MSSRDRLHSPACRCCEYRRGVAAERQVAAVLAGVGVRPVQQPVVGDDRVSGAQGERDLFRLVGHGGIALVEAG
jgi:hypothetical protein